jgi:hypothetical protein
MTAMLSYLKTAAGHIVGTWGEAVTYKPSVGATRSISAVIDRPGVRKSDIPGAYAANGPEILVRVINDSTTGITASEVNTGKDLISLAVRLGQTAQDRLITKVVSHDEGLVVLEVR